LLSFFLFFKSLPFKNSLYFLIVTRKLYRIVESQALFGGTLGMDVLCVGKVSSAGSRNCWAYPREANSRFREELWYKGRGTKWLRPGVLCHGMHCEQRP
jgi:hypothetical protein